MTPSAGAPSIQAFARIRRDGVHLDFVLVSFTPMRIAAFFFVLLPLFAIEACSDTDSNPEPTNGTNDASTSDTGTSTLPDGGTSDPDGGNTSDAKTDAAPDAPPAGAKKIFVTSLDYNGQLGATTGADGKCAARAFAANLAGTYKAWISTVGTDDAKTRLAHHTGPYVRIDGAIVASDWNELASNAHQAAIDIDEKGTKVAASSAVWTNTKPDGTSKGNEHCLSWNSPSNGEIGSYGVVDAKDSRWTDAAIGACEPKARLYCVEQ